MRGSDPRARGGADGGYVVVTDRQSTSDVDLYPDGAAAAGPDCVSVPLTDRESRALDHLEVLLRPPPLQLRRLWAGRLEFPSGQVVVAGRAMTTLVEVAVVPGAYDVVLGLVEGEPVASAEEPWMVLFLVGVISAL